MASQEQLILKRASAGRSSDQWRDDDYGVLCNGAVGPSHHEGPGRARGDTVAMDFGRLPELRATSSTSPSAARARCLSRQAIRCSIRE
jgi:hypothetical protein